MWQGERQRGFAIAALIVFVLGLGAPLAVQQQRRTLGPLDLDGAMQGSAVAVDREGSLLRAFTTADGRWRLPVQIEDVDPRFIAMLQAYEDRRFTEHGGLDWRAFARAAWQAGANLRIVSGGSTLTMQVARLLEPRDQRTLGAKIRQVLRASELERRLSKNEILNLYLALAPYGGNLEGLRAASLAYFGKEPRRLSLSEQALLVALPQAPELRRPDRFPQAALQARNRVLDRAARYGLLHQAEADAAKMDPVPTRRKAFPTLSAHATQAAHSMDRTRRSLRFTYDHRLQASMESLIRDAAERLGDKVTGALLVIDNATGEIRARVGAADYFFDARAGAVDMTQALRSPGSALKPFIYALAFENGIAHPETLIDDRPRRFGIYAPENFDLTFQGQVTARIALQNSLNIPAVTLLEEVGASRFLARLHNAGADIALPADAAPGLAIALGGLGVRLTDLVRLYAGLARGGSVPDLVERLDLEPPARQDRRIAEPVASWYVSDVLLGAPPPVSSAPGRIAFKTGTSFGMRDAVAIGFTRRLTIAVWFGRADHAAVPGLVARQAAAPVLFDAFARAGATEEPPPAPQGVMRMRTSQLPPPLRHLRKDAPKMLDAVRTAPLKIAFPPDGSRVEMIREPGAAPSLALKAQGGVAPFTWIVNGLPIGTPDLRRQSAWMPDGAGFARVSVVDAKGASDSIVVRLD